MVWNFKKLRLFCCYLHFTVFYILAELQLECLFFIIIMLVVLWKLKWILRMEQYIPSYFIILLWAFHFMICLTSNNKYLVVYGRENLNLTWCLVAFREKMSLQPLNLMLSLSQVNVCMFVSYSTCNNLRLRVFLWIGFASGLCNNLN